MAKPIIPARPWLRHADLGEDGACPVFDDNNHLVVVLAADLPDALAELVVIAPDLLTDLAGLLRAVLQLDPEYCRAHGMQFNPDALRDAAGEAVATLAHAKQHGLRVDVPGLIDLAEV